MNTRKALLLFASAAIVLSGLSCSERSIPVSYTNEVGTVSTVGTGTNIVSSDWLCSKLDKDYVVIDVRYAEDYAAGHIPNSINIPFNVISVWAQSDMSEPLFSGLWVELPELSGLIDNLGGYGISIKSKIVLVTGLPTEANPYSLAAPARVALTLAYAGVKKVAILDGTYDKWAAEGKPVTTEATMTTPVDFRFKSVADLFVDMAFVEENIDIGEVILVDARDEVVYDGTVMEPWALAPGHIPSAVSLPAPSLYSDDGIYKSKSEMQAIADAVIGSDTEEEIVVYCGVGGYAGVVWFALTQILEYENVKVYDGSAQEWFIEGKDFVID